MNNKERKSQINRFIHRKYDGHIRHTGCTLEDMVAE